MFLAEITFNYKFYREVEMSLILKNMQGEVAYDSVNFPDFDGVSISDFINYCVMNEFNLSEIDFSYLSLEKVNFNKTCLIKSKFNFTELKYVDFSCCDLTNVVFKNSELNMCVFIEADLSQTKFENSYFNICSFNKSKFLKSLFSKVNFNQCSFDESVFECTPMYKTHFVEVSFKKVDIINMNAENVTFHFTKLSNIRIKYAIFKFTSFCQCDFYRSTFTSVQFEYNNMVECDFEKSIFKEVKFDDSILKNNSFKDSSFKGTSLYGLYIGNKNLLTNTFEATSFSSTFFMPFYKRNISYKIVRGNVYIEIGCKVNTMEYWDKFFRPSSKLCFETPRNSSEFKLIQANYASIRAYIRTLGDLLPGKNK